MLTTLCHESAEQKQQVLQASINGKWVPHFQQRFIAARAAGKQGANELAGQVWAELKSQQQTIVKNGVNLQTENENLAELTEQATDFINLRVPVLSALGIV